MIHIVNNFVSSTVHASLISALSRTIDKQVVIIPIRDHAQKGMNSQDLDNVQIKYVCFRNNIIRYFPLLKVLFLSLRVNIFLRSINNSRVFGKRIDVIAHNFWSDGMLAFLNSFFIPMRYMMVVRNTDINYFISRLPHYRWLMKLAIKRSEGLSFVSKSHYLRFKSRWPSLLDCARKVEIIPNAISDWWLDRILKEPQSRGKQACFVGKFDANKNLVNLVKAAQLLHDVMPDFKLVVVGGSEEEFLGVTRLGSVPKCVEIPGKLPREALLNVYSSSRLFVMPSFTETFGLVYLEALSRGCSVICSSGEGIDGMWDQPFIRSVDPNSVSELARAMLELINGFPDGVPVSWSVTEISKFGWVRVADRYLEFFT